MIHRFTGKSRKKPVKTLDETSKQFDERIANMDGKEEALNKQLRRLKFEINKLPKGSPARKQKEARALGLLKQRRQYQKLNDQARNQQMVVDMQKHNVESMQMTVDLVRTMKTTEKEMTKKMKKLDIDKILDVKEDLDDMMMENEDIQDMLGENPLLDEFDDEDLMAEFEIEFDEELLEDNEVNEYIPENNIVVDKLLPPVPQNELDDYGLPPAPSKDKKKELKPDII